jgi:hypothetical protein
MTTTKKSPCRVRTNMQKNLLIYEGKNIWVGYVANGRGYGCKTWRLNKYIKFAYIANGI